MLHPNDLKRPRQWNIWMVYYIFFTICEDDRIWPDDRFITLLCNQIARAVNISYLHAAGFLNSVPVYWFWRHHVEPIGEIQYTVPVQQMNKFILLTTCYRSDSNEFLWLYALETRDSFSTVSDLQFQCRPGFKFDISCRFPAIGLVSHFPLEWTFLSRWYLSSSFRNGFRPCSPSCYPIFAGSPP